jgi:hypothetical protein
MRRGEEGVAIANSYQDFSAAKEKVGPLGKNSIVTVLLQNYTNFMNKGQSQYV